MRGDRAKFVPHEMRTSIIRVVSYEKKNMAGRLINPYFGGEVYFENLMQLIFLIEGMLDDLNCPQKGMEIRNFRNDERNTAVTADVPAQLAGRPALASFKLNILFRQNASWQGNVVWMDQGMESSFRSLLELIRLMDSVLCQ